MFLKSCRPCHASRWIKSLIVDGYFRWKATSRCSGNNDPPACLALKQKSTSSAVISELSNPLILLNSVRVVIRCPELIYFSSVWVAANLENQYLLKKLVGLLGIHLLPVIHSLL